jgi:N-acetylglucosamine kinase-like BadF-type ATPase
MPGTRSLPQPLYLGIDGGQSSTTALIGDVHANVLAKGKGGPSNHVKAEAGRARLIDAVTEALESAASQLGCDNRELRFEAACLGFTGGMDDKEPILREIVSAQHLLVTDDVTIALAGAHEAGGGVVTIAGTGSVAMARNTRGEIARAGGWGYAFGDDGGAWGIVREALRAALRWKEGWGPATKLHDLFLHETGDPDIHAFRRRLYTEEYPRPRVAAFSTLVDRAAQEGDAVAIEVLRAAAGSLAQLSRVVRGRVFPPSEDVEVAHIGGVFTSTLVLDEFRRLIEEDGHSRLIAPRHDPATGALREAVRWGHRP